MDYEMSVRGVPLPSCAGADLSAQGDCVTERIRHRAVECGLDVRQFATGHDDVVCITLYNEDVGALRSSLHSVVASAQRASRTATSRSLCVCILADGVERESQSVTQYLVDHGLLPSALVSPQSAEVDFYHSIQDTSRWLADAALPDAWQVHFVVGRKHRNMGKMHSHALFFGHLCPMLMPQRCWQLDAGTQIGVEAMAEMIRCMDQDEMVAAVGARIQVPAPDDADSFVKRWQYMDFSVQLATLWPSEMAAGHLSVVPGQFCLFRWAALSAPGTDGAQTPVERYLRGLNPAGAMECIMFLAEDRVVGNELVLNGDRPWRIGYCSTGGAVTDACETLQELRRQRRRWNNCSFACRLWLLGRWPKQILRRDRNLHHKLYFTSGTLWQGLLVVMQCMTPAFAVSRWFMWWAALNLAWREGYRPAVTATVCMVLASLLLGLRRPENSAALNRAAGLVRDAVGALTLLMLMACMVLVAPLWLVALLMLPSLAAAVLPLLFGNVSIVSRRQYLRHIPEYAMFEGLFQSYLWGYALFHLGDTSWGTKGLTRGLRNAKSGEQRKQLRSAYELAIWVVFLLANGFCLLALFGMQGVAASPSNPVSECAALLMIVVLVVALLGHRQMEMGRLGSGASADQAVDSMLMAVGDEEEPVVG